MRKEQLANILNLPENQEELLKGKLAVEYQIMVWGWGASVEIVGDSGLRVRVPYFQEEVERTEDEAKALKELNHHAKVQEYFLNELLLELKNFMMDNYSKEIEVSN